LRVAILNKLIFRELLKLRISGRASAAVVIDNKIVPEDEVDRVAALFFTWMALLLVGGGITALFSNLGPWESFSGMFSAMGNIGPCYISVPDMIAIHPLVKLTYIFGMFCFPERPGDNSKFKIQNLKLKVWRYYKMYIVVTGGGMVGGGLVRSLLDNKHDVVLIEQHKELCDKLYAAGGATSIQALDEAGIKKADVVVAATGSDADNLACAILAKSFDVPRIIVRMRDPAYKNAYIVAGVSSIVRVTDLMVNQIMMDIENPEVRKITTIGGGKADIFIATVPDGAKIAGKSIKDIVGSRHFPNECSRSREASK